MPMWPRVIMRLTLLMCADLCGIKFWRNWMLTPSGFKNAQINPNEIHKKQRCESASFNAKWFLRAAEWRKPPRTIILSFKTRPISCSKSLINGSCLPSVFLPDLNNALPPNLQIDNSNHCPEGQKLMIELILLSLFPIYVLKLAQID